jgi:hypothetical protein
MLPTNVTIVCTFGDRVIAAATLFVDSVLKLPIEDNLSLYDLRHGPQRCAELSSIAVDPEASNSHELKLLLYRFAILYSSQYLGINHLISQFADPELVREREYFKNVNCDGKKILYTDLSNLEPHNFVSNEQFHFPERVFYEMSDCHWNLATFKYFFIEQTDLLEQSNESELRAIQNIYDFGEFAKIFTNRRSIAGARRMPRFRRFSMNCSASIPNNAGSIYLQILDVSLQGARAYIEDELALGTSYALQISVGVSSYAEVIAKVAWKNPAQKQIGFELSSGDPKWKQLIAHLEAKAA